MIQRYQTEVDMAAKASKANERKSDEWYTPRWLVDALGTFDTDPCTPQRGHWTAKTCYTIEENGLKQPWTGRVFLNPPYSDIDPWILKMTRHGNGILLVFAKTETQWMDQALCFANAICFLSQRVKFVDIGENTEGSPKAPSVLLAFGDENVEAIATAIAEGKIDGRLFGEIVPQIYLNERDEDFQREQPSMADYQRWADEAAETADRDAKRLEQSPFERWRRRAQMKLDRQ